MKRYVDILLREAIKKFCNPLSGKYNLILESRRFEDEPIANN